MTQISLARHSVSVSKLPLTPEPYYYVQFVGCFVMTIDFMPANEIQLKPLSHNPCCLQSELNYLPDLSRDKH